MSRPSLVSSFIASTDIAGEAISTLGAARKKLSELEALFRAIANVADEHSDLAMLASLGAYAAMDHGNGLDCLREEYESCLEKFAPQIVEAQNVARESEVTRHES